MTRRQKLANECVEACLADEVCLSDEECSRVRKHVAKVLQSVEREVWMTVRKELERDPLIKCFLERNFWDAHHVDLIWRHNGKDKVYQADWIKSIWYKCKEQQTEVGE